jgi:hypothetical protein
MDGLFTYVHEHAIWVAIGLGVLAWILSKAYSEDEKGWAWAAALAGIVAAVVFIWHLADPWVKDPDLVKPLGMIEMVQARMKLNPKDEAAQQAWQMIRDKMAEVDPETRACVFARKNLKSDPARALVGLVPDVNLDGLVLELLASLKRLDSKNDNP